jgi:hypothetical protein
MLSATVSLSALAGPVAGSGAFALMTGAVGAGIVAMYPPMYCHRTARSCAPGPRNGSSGCCAPPADAGAATSSGYGPAGGQEGCPRQDSNLRTRLRRPVTPTDPRVSGVRGRLARVLCRLQRPYHALVRPTNRSTSGQRARSI